MVRDYTTVQVLTTLSSYMDQPHTKNWIQPMGYQVVVYGSLVRLGPYQSGLFLSRQTPYTLTGRLRERQWQTQTR